MTRIALAPGLRSRRDTAPRCPCAPGTAVLAMRVAGVVLAAIALVAVLVRIAAAAAARDWLAYPFTGIPATTDQAAAIFAHNVWALLCVIGLLLIAQAAAHWPGGRTRIQAWLQTAGEIVLAGVVATNALIVGAALGAYGTRMVRAMLPHGPVELAGFATAIAHYHHARDRALPARQLLLTATVSVLMLGAGALLEALVVV
jgi:hypothetical protein